MGSSERGGVPPPAPAPAARSEAESEADARGRWGGVLPKDEIGATELASLRPEADGRGVRIAILDTGVDPGALGLGVTSVGGAKVVDVVDCSGSGDTDTSTVVRLEGDGTLKGLYGAVLRPNPLWVASNPSGAWHVGARPAFGLMPGPLVQRLREARRQDLEEAVRGHVQGAVNGVAAWRASHGDGQGTQGLSGREKRAKEELEARVEVLEALGKAQDVGPMVHCVVWHDGENWLGALDTSALGEGDGVALADAEALPSFRVGRRFATLGRKSQMNYALNVYEDGKVLSIVTDSGSHGTHVAGIAAGFHPGEGRGWLSGVAPGAEIVSLKIGDSRLGGMETGTAVIRALAAARGTKCDLINMSFGEACSLPNQGRFVELATRLVHKHGIVFLASAGNDGPALSTVGAPGGTSSALISVGAHVTPPMMEAAHSVRADDEGGAPHAEGLQYTWSSRGPAADGYLGVTVSAPGGAIACVPQWTLARSQLMNGTSMSSPNAAGGVALLLSALKADGIPYTPASIRRAIEATARGCGEPAYTCGAGLLDVPAALAWIKAHGGDLAAQTPLEVSVPSRGSGFRGLYLREPLETGVPWEGTARVTPHFAEEGRDHRESDLAYEQNLLVSATASWIKCPKALVLGSKGRDFSLLVDPTRLPPGVHYAQVVGHDLAAATAGAGPAFRLPVVVVKGIPVPTEGGDPRFVLPATPFAPGRIERRFVHVPDGATHAEVTLRSAGHVTPRQIWFQCVQMCPQGRRDAFESHNRLTFATAGAVKTVAFAVRPGSTLEVCAAQFWSSLGGCELSYEVEFHGVLPSERTVALDGAMGYAKVEVQAPLRDETLHVTAKLTSVRRALRPDAGELTVIGGREADPAWDRDCVLGEPGRHTAQLVLSYAFEIEGDEAVDVRPRVGLLNGLVYENQVETQMLVVYDANRKRVLVSDIYPAKAKLSPGKYDVRLCLRHESVATLEKLRHLPLALEVDLPDKKAAAIPVYASLPALQMGKGPLKGGVALARGTAKALYFAAPDAAGLPSSLLGPKGSWQDAVLLGTVSYVKTREGKPAPLKDAKVLFAAPPPPAKAKKDGPGSGSGSGAASGAGPANADANANANDSNSGASASATSEEEGVSEKGKEDAERPSFRVKLDEELRDKRVAFLEKMSDAGEAEKSEYTEYAAELEALYPGHLPLLTEALKRADKAKGVDGKKDVPRVVAAADKVIAAAGGDDLAIHLAQRKDWADALESEADGAGSAVAERKKKAEEFEKRKKALVDALKRKALALVGDGGTPPPAELEACYAELCKWADPSKPDALALFVRRERASGRPASALKHLNATLVEGEGKDVAAILKDANLAAADAHALRLALLKDLGWDAHAVRVVERFHLASPHAYERF